MDVVHQNSSGSRAGSPTQERFLDHEETIINAGWLWKASKFLGVFRKRFCVLTEQSNLYFFPEPVLKMSACTDMLNLAQSRTRFVEGDSVVDGQARDMQAEKWQKHIGTGEHFPFMLNLRPRVPTFADFRYIRDITLVAGSSHERERWVKAFASLESGIELLRSADMPLSGEVSPASSFAGDIETVCAICLESFNTGLTLMDEWPSKQEGQCGLDVGSSQVVLTGLSISPGTSSIYSDTDSANDGGVSSLIDSVGGNADEDPERLSAYEQSSLALGEDNNSQQRSPVEQREVFQLGCGHTFCRDCIERWASEKRFCPECRAVF